MANNETQPMSPNEMAEACARKLMEACGRIHQQAELLLEDSKSFRKAFTASLSPVATESGTGEPWAWAIVNRDSGCIISYEPKKPLQLTEDYEAISLYPRKPPERDVAEAFRLLGSAVDVIDHLSRGDHTGDHDTGFCDECRASELRQEIRAILSRTEPKP